jgi:molybdopterin-binding protein
VGRRFDSGAAQSFCLPHGIAQAYVDPIESREESMKLSARNVLKGTIKQITDGAVNSEVTIELPGGATVVAIINRESVSSLGLAVGKDACAVIKASSVMVAVD